MFKTFLESCRQQFPSFPSARRPRLGSVIKSIRIDKGIPQKDFAERVRIHESTLKNIENDHQQATTAENLNRCANTLGLSLEELILMGREWDEANYFAIKRAAPKKIEGIRHRKRAPIEWYQSTRIRFRDFDLIPISAPINARKDFFCARVTLPPKRALRGLTLGTHHPIVGFVHEGFNLDIHYNKKKFPVTSHQAFALDGFSAHDLINNDEDHTATLYLIAKLPNEQKNALPPQTRSKLSGQLNIAEGLNRLRQSISQRPGHPVSLQYLSDVTDHLDYQQIHKLIRVRKKTAAIYWDKIEDILGGTGVSLDDFLHWAHGKTPQPFYLATAATRAHTEYLTEGVRIYHATPPGIKNHFLCGEVMISGKKAKSWKRQDFAMCALYLEQGELEITVGGKLRAPLPLAKGESIYFDASLGYTLRNPATHQVKAFLATYPAIQI